MSLSETLKNIRQSLSTRRKKSTQRDMATFLGTSQSAYSEMENGKRELSRRDGLLIMALEYLRSHRKLKDFLRWVDSRQEEPKRKKGE